MLNKLADVKMACNLRTNLGSKAMKNSSTPASARPVSTRRSLPIALLRARETVMQRFRPHLAELGLTEQQWRVLRVLGEDGASEAGQISERACILPPSLSRILKTMQVDGWLKVTGDKSDGRRSIVNLTARGEKLLAKAAPNSSAIYAAIEAQIGKSELDELLNALERLQAALREP
jgi:homoprotocatechuate degradation regulator HpaR